MRSFFLREFETFLLGGLTEGALSTVSGEGGSLCLGVSIQLCLDTRAHRSLWPQFPHLLRVRVDEEVFPGPASSRLLRWS